MTPRLSRREFLNLGASAAAGFAMGPLTRVNVVRPLPPSEANPARWGLGRIAQWRLNVRTEPNRNADILRHIYEDEVIAIVDAVVGGTDPAHNRTWYALEEGYIHSGWVQPVAYNYQTPLRSFPGSSFIAEVSVPFVDARQRTGGSRFEPGDCEERILVETQDAALRKVDAQGTGSICLHLTTQSQHLCFAGCLEALLVREAGDDIVDDLVQDSCSGSLTLGGFLRNDGLCK